MKIRKITDILHPAAQSLQYFHLLLKRSPGNRDQGYTEMNRKLHRRKVEATIFLDVRLLQD